MFRRVSAAAMVCGLLAASPALADESDFSGWFNFTGNGPVHGKVLGWAEVQGRFQDDASRLRQSIIRPAVGYRVAPKFDVYVGYGLITNHNPGVADVVEDRAWQQLSWAGTQVAGGTLTTRSRLEQRWIRGADGTGWRFRQLFKWNKPLRQGGDTSFVLNSETFIALNDTRWGVQAGFDQSRNFAGIGFSVTKTARLELGYMNQFINRIGPNDRMNHVAQTNLLVRF